MGRSAQSIRVSEYQYVQQTPCANGAIRGSEAWAGADAGEHRRCSTRPVTGQKVDSKRCHAVSSPQLSPEWMATHIKDPQLMPYYSQASGTGCTGWVYTLGSKNSDSDVGGVSPPFEVTPPITSGHFMHESPRQVIHMVATDGPGHRERDEQEWEMRVKNASRTEKPQQNTPPHTWDRPERPWSRIHIDYAGPFLGKMFLIIVDAHSKWTTI